MVFSLTDLDLFEEWFYRKLMKEKERRIEYVTNVWNKLVPDQRANLIFFTENKFLVRFCDFIISKSFNALFTIVRENLVNSYELIEEWENVNIPFN